MNYKNLFIPLIMMAMPLMGMEQRWIQKSLSVAPAALCHPGVARMATNACMMVAQPKSDNARQYMQAAFMMGGGLATAYLVNRNICTPAAALQYAKKAGRKLRPYAFTAPALVAFNSEFFRDMIMHQLPVMSPSFETSVSGMLNKTLIVGGVAGAGYLFLTQTLDLATQSYVTQCVSGVVERLQGIRTGFTRVQELLHKAGAKMSGLFAAADAQLQALLKLSAETDRKLSVLETLHAEVKDELRVTQGLVQLLQELAEQADLAQLDEQTEIVAKKLRRLKEHYREKIAAIPVKMNGAETQLVETLALHKQQVAGAFKALAMICQDQSGDIAQIKNQALALAAPIQKNEQALSRMLERLQQAQRMLKDNSATIAAMQQALTGETPQGAEDDSFSSDEIVGFIPHGEGGSRCQPIDKV